MEVGSKKLLGVGGSRRGEGARSSVLTPELGPCSSHMHRHSRIRYHFVKGAREEVHYLRGAPLLTHFLIANNLNPDTPVDGAKNMGTCA